MPRQAQCLALALLAVASGLASLPDYLTDLDFVNAKFVDTSKPVLAVYNDQRFHPKVSSSRADLTISGVSVGSGWPGLDKFDVRLFCRFYSEMYTWPIRNGQ